MLIVKKPYNVTVVIINGFIKVSFEIVYNAFSNNILQLIGNLFE